MQPSEWSKAIKAADPLGFYDHTPADQVDAAREAGRSSFEAAESAFAPKREELERARSVADPPDAERMRELMKNLGGGDGRPLDPVKVKKFTEMLEPNDPWRQQLEALTVSAADDNDVAVGGRVPEDLRRAQRDNLSAHVAKNAGEVEVEAADGTTWRWEQTSKNGESEVLVRFTLSTPATKKAVKVVFKVQHLTVTVAGETLLDAKTCGKMYPEESTWSLTDKTESGAFSELQVLISLAEDVKWHDLCAKA